jgi:hypothetical protein
MTFGEKFLISVVVTLVLVVVFMYAVDPAPYSHSAPPPPPPPPDPARYGALANPSRRLLPDPWIYSGPSIHLPKDILERMRTCRIENDLRAINGLEPRALSDGCGSGE